MYLTSVGKILFLLFLVTSQIGRSMEKSQEVVFAEIKKVLIIKTENGVCSFGGKYPYKLQNDSTDKKFRLVCDVQQSGFKFNSEIPIELIENFNYPERIHEDIRTWHSYSKNSKLKDPALNTAMKLVKHKWGTEYFWETPSTGSTKYSYLQPSGANYCIQVKVGGLEKLTFDIKNKSGNK